MPPTILNNAQTPTVKTATGASSIQLKIDFTVSTSYSWNETSTGATGIQSVFIDNSGGASPVWLTVLATGQTIVCPAYSQGFFPAVMNNSPQLIINSATNGSVVTVLLLNFVTPANVWGARVSALVSDPALEMALAGNALRVTDPILEGAVSNGVVRVSDASAEQSDAAILAALQGVLAVKDASAETSDAAILAVLQGVLAVADKNSAAYSSSLLVTPGTPCTPGSALAVSCTVAGSMTITLPDNSTMTLPLSSNGGALQLYPYAVKLVTIATGTVATFWINK